MLAAAVLHALWNTLIAGARDTHATTAVALVAAVVAFAPAAALTWEVDGAAVPFIAGSAALHLGYFALLAAAYSRADLTVVYPIARGMAPVLVLGISVGPLGAALSAGEAAGVLAVTAGVLLVRGIGRDVAGSGLALALAVAVSIAAYTLVDDHGVRHAAAVAYLEAMLVVIAIPYAAAVATARGAGVLRAAVTCRALLAGGAMFGAYALVLAALEVAEAAPVAALRETSVVMAAAWAALTARERIPPRRLAGAAVVAGGIAAIALA